MSLHTFVKQFIGNAVAPTETSGKSLKHHHEHWQQDVRNQQQKMRLIEDAYEQKYNQPRIAMTAARRHFEAQAEILKGEEQTTDFYQFMDSRPVSVARDIFTKYLLE
jgi:hypothetical protein